jgi:hypothetical protein
VIPSFFIFIFMYWAGNTNFLNGTRAAEASTIDQQHPPFSPAKARSEEQKA